MNIPTGFLSAPVVEALKKYHTPVCPKGLVQRTVYTEWTGDEPIDCWLDITPASGDGFHEPKLPMKADLYAAYVRGVDIYVLLSDEVENKLVELALQEDPL